MSRQPQTGPRVLLAPDKFKGSLSAKEAATAMLRGFRKGWPGCSLRQLPLTDGGEGFVETITRAARGKIIRVPRISNAVGKAITAPYGWIPSTRTAIIGLNEAAGLAPLKPHERNPALTTTFGVGQLILHAWERGASQIIIGLGGSATNDGGTGIAKALGWKFLDRFGKELPAGTLALKKLHSIVPGIMPNAALQVACDVSNPLLGKQGASYTFGPQKGATPTMARSLDQALSRLAHVAATGAERLPGSGAAGGAAYGLVSFCGGAIESGFDLFSNTTQLHQILKKTDIVITGEGCLDSQTLSGKAPEGLRRLCEKRKIPIIALGGTLLDRGKFSSAFSILQQPMPLEQAQAQAAHLLETTSQEVARTLRIGFQHR